MTTRKPPAVPFMVSHETLCRLFAEADSSASDRFLVQMVQISTMEMEVFKMFDYNHPGSCPLNIDTVEMSINTYERQLQNISDSSKITDDFFQGKLRVLLIGIYKILTATQC